MFFFSDVCPSAQNRLTQVCQLQAGRVTPGLHRRAGHPGVTATVGVSSASQTCHSPSRSRHLLWGGAPRSLSEGQRQPPPIPTPSSSWPDKEKLQRSWGLWSEGAGSRPCSPSCTGLRRPLCPSFRVPESPREAAPGSLQPAQSLTVPGWAAGRSLGKGDPASSTASTGAHPQAHEVTVPLQEAGCAHTPSLAWSGRSVTTAEKGGCAPDTSIWPLAALDGDH